MPKKVETEGVQRAAPDTEMIAVALWIQSKRIVRQRRANEAKARARQQERRRRRGHE